MRAVCVSSLSQNPATSPTAPAPRPSKSRHRRGQDRSCRRAASDPTDPVTQPMSDATALAGGPHQGCAENWCLGRTDGQYRPMLAGHYDAPLTAGAQGPGSFEGGCHIGRNRSGAPPAGAGFETDVRRGCQPCKNAPDGAAARGVWGPDRESGPAELSRRFGTAAQAYQHETGVSAR